MEKFSMKPVANGEVATLELVTCTLDNQEQRDNGVRFIIRPNGGVCVILSGNKHQWGCELNQSQRKIIAYFLGRAKYDREETRETPGSA